MLRDIQRVEIGRLALDRCPRCSTFTIIDSGSLDTVDQIIRMWAISKATGFLMKEATTPFGFRETARLTTPEGKLSHGEMEAGNGLIMLASPTPDYRSPKRHREVCEQARKWSAVPWIIDGVLVYVDNLDRHFERAKTAGATILSAIEEGPPGRRLPGGRP